MKLSEKLYEKLMSLRAWHSEAKYWKDEVAKLEQQIEALLRALRKYSYHRGGCAALIKWHDSYSSNETQRIPALEQTDPLCDCGLRDALLAQASEE